MVPIVLVVVFALFHVGFIGRPVGAVQVVHPDLIGRVLLSSADCPPHLAANDLRGAVVDRLCGAHTTTKVQRAGPVILVSVIVADSAPDAVLANLHAAL